MMVESPAGVLFRIDVKGVYSPNSWLIRPREVETDLYYVLAYVPEPPKQCEFFVLTHPEVDAVQTTGRARLNRPKSYPMQGISWTEARGFKDCWKSLPG
jgi:hypothetical protein